MDIFTSHKLVKSEDLNHHHTLYAGRCAEWVVESGFVAVASLLGAEHVVCAELHGMRFSRQVRSGEIVVLRSRAVLAGRTSVVVHVAASVSVPSPLGASAAPTPPFVESFLRFVHVGPDSRPMPHGLVIAPTSEEERQLEGRARGLAG